jgi:predicted GIY-YIG superfamily endonuclease
MEGDPLPDEPPMVYGGYAKDVNTRFQQSHFALWGRQAAQTKGEIQKMVADYQPTHLLVLLGFNDLGVRISSRK